MLGGKFDKSICESEDSRDPEINFCPVAENKV